MKSLKSIFSAFLALMVVLSSFSLTINKHICMGRVQSVAILHDATPCAMELMADDGKNISKMEGCCRDEQTKIEGNDYPVKQVKPLTVEYQSLWVAALPAVIETFNFENTTTHHSLLRHKPPLIEREIPILLQSFLI